MYVSMKKQDAFIRISDGSVLKTRMTFAELQDALSANFIREPLKTGLKRENG